MTFEDCWRGRSAWPALRRASSQPRSFRWRTTRRLFGARRSGPVSSSLSPDRARSSLYRSAPGPGAQTALKSSILQTSQITTILGANGRPEALRLVRLCVRMTKLVCRYSGNAPYEPTAWSISAAGGGRPSTARTSRPLAQQRRQVTTPMSARTTANILDWLPDDAGVDPDGARLMFPRSDDRDPPSANNARAWASTGSTWTLSSKTVRVEPSPGRVSNYMTDGRGKVRLVAIEFADRRASG